MNTPIKACPLCAPRPDENPLWLKVATLGVSSLYLDKNQTYRGHCILIHDEGHFEGLEKLSEASFGKLMQDVRRAANAIVTACQPDLMNYASMGNVVPHVHWHIVPRYKGDPRWGSPIYTSNLADMRVTPLADADYRALIEEIRQKL